MLNQKNSFLKKKQNNFYYTLNRINTDNNTDNNKSKNTICLKYKQNLTNTRINSLDSNSVTNYEQRKIKVFKNRSPSSLMYYNIKNNNTSLKTENNRIIISNNNNVNQKIENLFKTVSFKKDNNYNNKKKKLCKNFSLDFSLKDEKENGKIIKCDDRLLSPISRGKSNDKIMYSLSKKRYLRKISNKSIQNIDFDFDELNKRLNKMIQNLENHAEIKKRNNIEKNKVGFIKLDAFEKEIGQEN